MGAMTLPWLVLNRRQIVRLRKALSGRLIAVSFGAGIDSTAMLVALKLADIVPHIITFADTGCEKRPTLEHVEAMNRVMQEWGWPPITICKKTTLPSTGYTDLFGNCWKNETLPSLAFGMKSCSIKWKQVPQDQHIMGVTRGPNKCPPHPLWIQAQARGEKIVKLIGYDCGPADMRRSVDLVDCSDGFDYVYPLQLIGWHRTDCVDAITAVLGPALVPIKSACFMCPASKVWELYWLAAHHPDMLEDALRLERRALTGRHSRFDQVEFGASWDELVRTADRFPSTKTTVGLGRSFAWNQWARVNNVVDVEFRVRRSPADRARFLQMADQLRGDGLDNAQDARTKRDVIMLAVA